MNKKILILSLHRLGKPPQKASIRGLFTTPGLLIFEIRLLKLLGYQFATLKDAMNDSSSKTAVITFDDGYSDNLHLGFPILDRMGIAATLFVITGDVGRNDVVWDEAGDKLPADMLTWKEIIKLKKAGWEIGSHSQHHVHMDRYDSEKQESLIFEAKDAFEKHLGEMPLSYAYPYGAYDERTKTILRRSGIRYAVTINSPNKVSANDNLELPRIAVGGRHFYHYVKLFVRTISNIGFTTALMSLLPKRAELTALSIATRIRS